jgi:hypothetical protein
MIDCLIKAHDFQSPFYGEKFIRMKVVLFYESFRKDTDPNVVGSLSKH